MNTKTRRLVVTGLLVAIEAILAQPFVPIGFIPIGPVSATTLHIPVIIGAVLEGPMVGAVLGLFFGLFSILSEYLKPDAFFPVFTNPVIAILPRILIGLGAGYIFKGFEALELKGSKAVSGKISGALIYWVGVFGLIYASYQWLALLFSPVSIIQEIKTGISLIPGAVVLVLAVLYFKKYVNGNKRDIGAGLAGVIGTMINAGGVLGLMALFGVENIVTIMPKTPDLLWGFYAAIITTNTIPEVIAAAIIVFAVFKAMKPIYTRRKASIASTRSN